MVKQCAVCLDELGTKNVMTTECGHTFCATCIITNLHHSNKCPMCRTVIDSDANHGGSGNGNALPIEEVEQQAHMLISAMDINERIAKQIFDAYPYCEWDSLPSDVKDVMLNSIQRGFLNFAMDFHMFIHPEDYTTDDVPELEDDHLDNDNDNDNDNEVQIVPVPTRQNTVITRPVELNAPVLSPEINDLIHNLDMISDEPTRIRDHEPVEVEGHDIINIINNDMQNFNLNYQIINWGRLDQEPIPNIEFD